MIILDLVSYRPPPPVPSCIKTLPLSQLGRCCPGPGCIWDVVCSLWPDEHNLNITTTGRMSPTCLDPDLAQGLQTFWRTK